MAPEVMRSEPFNEKADVYRYVALAGMAPSVLHSPCCWLGRAFGPSQTVCSTSLGPAQEQKALRKQASGHVWLCTAGAACMLRFLACSLWQQVVALQSCLWPAHSCCRQHLEQSHQGSQVLPAGTACKCMLVQMTALRVRSGAD